MTTLLNYALTTDPFPLQASPSSGAVNIATLTVVASNPSPSSPVTIYGLSITLPVGPDADDLTADAEDIGPVAPDGWTLAATKPGAGQVEYVFQPEAGQGQVGAQGLAFVFNAVSVNSQPGLCEIVVREGTDGDPTAQLPLAKFPNDWGTVFFWVDQPTIAAGGSTELHWTGPAGATYSIEYYTPQAGIVNVPALGQPALSNQGQYPSQGAPPLSLQQTTTFTLNVSEEIDGQPFFAQEQKTVTVETPAPIITLFHAKMEWSPTPTLVLQWASQYVDHCDVSGFSYQLDPSSPPGGTKFPLTPESPLRCSYTLTATNAAGTATSVIDVSWYIPVAVPTAMPPDLYIITVSPDGSRLYAGQVNIDGGQQVFYIFNSVTFDTVRQLDIPFAPNGGTAFSPDGSRLYLCDTTNTLRVLDPDTLNVRQQTTVGTALACVAVSPDGSRLYLTDSANAIYVLDAATLRPVGPPVKVSHPPYGIAVSPDGSRVYATLVTSSINPTLGGSVVAFEPTGDNNDPLTPVGQPASMAYAPQTIAVSPDGAQLFVTSGTPAPQYKPTFPIFIYQVIVLDAASLQILGAPISTPGNAFGVAISPDGSRLFVTQFGQLSAYAPAFTGGTSS